MGREVRKVAEGWEHPKGSHGYVPLYGRSFSKELEEWDVGAEKWAEGLRYSYVDGEWVEKGDDKDYSYSEWAGARPIESDYMPDWPEEERVLLMMYEDTSEGTPISPAFASAEDLAQWLADNGASSFGSSTATYEQWLATIKRGSAPSAILSSKGLQSGVEALG